VNLLSIALEKSNEIQSAVASISSVTIFAAVVNRTRFRRRQAATASPVAK